MVDWPAFPDSAAALARLKARFRLGVITNCDDDLFAASNERLGVDFDWIVTAQQVGSYKPTERNFDAARSSASGCRGSAILHVAQSLFHDHAPAQRLGMTTVWIDRRHGRPGSGATPEADAAPNATFPDMASFAAAAVPALTPRSVAIIRRPAMPSWIVQTNGYAPGAEGREEQLGPRSPGSTIVRVAAVDPGEGQVVREARGVVERDRDRARRPRSTVSAGSKAVVSPGALVIVTSTVAAGLGLAA